MRIEFTLDCTDLQTQSRFWTAAVGCAVEAVIEDRYMSLRGDAITLTLQRVPESKTGKNRMHLDLLVDDFAAEISRLESLGATRLTPEPRLEFGQTWYVLADPEGNEFCLARDPSSPSTP